MPQYIDGAAAKLLRIGRVLDQLADESNGIPDAAMDILTNAQFDIHEILMNYPVRDRSDLSAKFDLLGDLTRDGETYYMETDLIERAKADLREIQLRDREEMALLVCRATDHQTAETQAA
ncbi:hypothetical protein [Pelagibacterium lacus]|uniref:Uncharacterized protein n=1 Tax=Pelagibacterium lacus TaxID=2282655 RepID=A0A369WAE0_9HYPH|nr:hypothetical protein [Pelagibacterium lacus]RDE10340.1 hypothetical protein DVH29_02845 [Pelagibacterium lacus]